MSSRPASHHASRSNPKALDAYVDRIVEQAKAEGLPRETAECLIGIDASAFAWRRRTLKAEMSRQMLAELDVDIEQAEFEALTAASRLSYGIGSTSASDVTIGNIAEEMNIDASRSSRLVAALVRKGYLRREIAQHDARQSVLIATEKSNELFEAFMALKWRTVFSAFKDWSQRDLKSFERLLSRYIASTDEALETSGSANTADRHARRQAAISSQTGRTRRRG